MGFYDKPEGEDIVGKMLHTTKYAAFTAFWVGLGDVMLYSHPKGYLRTIGRMGFYMVPMVGMAAAWTAGTYISANIRKKDDYVNYWPGGIMAAGILGRWCKSPQVGIYFSVVFPLIGMTKKHSIVTGWEFFPRTKLAQQGKETTHRDHDFTWAPDVRGNWIRAEDVGKVAE